MIVFAGNVQRGERAAERDYFEFDRDKRQYYNFVTVPSAYLERYLTPAGLLCLPLLLS